MVYRDQTRQLSVRAIRRAGRVPGNRFSHSTPERFLQRIDRNSLLLGTALATTLLLGTVVAPTPAAATVTCASDVGPAPILHNDLDTIICVNTQAHIGVGSAISLRTTGVGNSIELSTTGALTAVSAGGAYTISVRSYGTDSPITINSDSDVTATSTGGGTGLGFFTFTNANNSAIDIVSSGDITISTIGFADAILGRTRGVGSAVTIVNSGDITVGGGLVSLGVYGLTEGANSAIDIDNSGNIDAIAEGASAADGIKARAVRGSSRITIANSGDISATADTGRAYGVYARANGQDSTVEVTNSGDIWATSNGGNAIGIFAETRGASSPVTIDNRGDLTISSENSAFGISVNTRSAGNTINIANSGDILATSTGGNATGIFAETQGANSPVTIDNRGDLTVSSGNFAFGISVDNRSAGNTINVGNSANITATGGTLAFGIRTFDYGGGSPINIVNSGDITATGATNNVGILAYSFAGGSPINIVNSGDITASGTSQAAGLAGLAPAGTVRIENSGKVFSLAPDRSVGIYATSGLGTTIVNSGEVLASSLLAIDAKGTGRANVYNSGTITGYVSLTGQNDRFVNQAGGVFETKLVSFFGGGNDIFRNENGGTLQAATNRNVREISSFSGLERFENSGLISLQDGRVGDAFRISNTPGGKDLDFVASGNSRLAVDAFLGGPGSTSDTLTIDGDVSGRTAVTVNNTNTGPGVFNSTGIRVVTVTGTTPNEGAFYLDQPIDTGFFDYDPFFTPTGSGFWDLRSFAGAGAFLLPQLVTAAQDIWHQGSATWFDRTTDLRVLLNGGGANSSTYGATAAPNDGLTPAVWVRGSGGWLDRDDSVKTSAYGRTYEFNLDRALQTIDFQMGLDMGTRDLLSQGDVLVFGMLGGFIHGGLDYDNIDRNFDFDGGQVGAYATYMKGGLFVDALLNLHLYELNANGALGFPSDLDATTVGLRTDTGYRFGSFSGGMFLEPLATLEVTWADIDGFSVSGNTVSFDDDANVRGRLGLRAGTTMEAWEGTMMEPFITGSLWSNLRGDNQATLVSSGSTFRFEDKLDDVWGEVSAGVNFFNFSQTTAVFAKVDVTFGDDVAGVGGKAGMRVSW